MPKHSIKGLVEYEIIENVKLFHQIQIQPLKKRGLKKWVKIMYERLKTMRLYSYIDKSINKAILNLQIKTRIFPLYHI